MSPTVIRYRPRPPRISKRGKRGKQKEAGVKEAIVKYLALQGTLVLPTPVRAIFDPKSGEWIKPSKAQLGMADLIALSEGRATWIETKATKGQSADQKRFQAKVEAAGCVYILARGIDDISSVFPMRERKKPVRPGPWRGIDADGNWAKKGG